MQEDRMLQIKILQNIYKNFSESEELVNILIENFNISEIDDFIKKLNEKN